MCMPVRGAWSPSSAPVRALGHLPPSGGKAKRRAEVVAPHRQPPQLPRYFRGMAPAAARRAKPVQRSSCQGLPGNPDACRPRRGVVGPSYGSFASGQARKLIPSVRRGPQLPQAPANGAGGDAGPVLSSQSQPTAAMGPGSRVEGAGGAFDENPREATSKNAGPGGFPTAFDTKSGAPAAQAPPGAPPAGGWRAESPRPTSSAQVTDRSLRRKRQSSFPPLCLLSPRRPLRPYIVGPSCGSLASPQAAKLVPSTVPPLPTTTTPLGRRGGPIRRADGIRPYGPGSCHTAPAGGTPGMPRPTCRRRWRRPFGS